MNLIGKKRKLTVLITVFIMFALLQGCGGGNPTNDFEDERYTVIYEEFFSQTPELIQTNWRDDFIISLEMRPDDPMMTVNGESIEIEPGQGTAPFYGTAGNILLPVKALADFLGIELEEGHAKISHAATEIVEELLLLNVTELPDGRIIMTRPFQTGRLAVKTDDPSVFEGLEGLTDIIPAPFGIHVLQFAGEQAAKTAADALEADRAVSYALPDFIIGPDNYRSWGAPRISAPEFKATLPSGLPTVTVAVLDTGVDAAHPFFRGRVTNGWCFILDNNNPYDVHGHGTHVAGTIAETTLDNVRIMPVKVLSDSGPGSALGVWMGIIWAAENGADVINMSLGGGERWEPYREAVVYATRRNSVVVVAAGNDNTDASNRNLAWIPEAITVAATDNIDRKASFSNFGSIIDVAAPGVGINSALPGGGFGAKSGTSMAAPHVSAAIALLKSDPRFAGLSPGEMQTFLRTLTDDAGDPGFDIIFGHGIVNLARVETEEPKPEPEQPGRPGDGEYTLQLTADQKALLEQLQVAVMTLDLESAYTILKSSAFQEIFTDMPVETIFTFDTDLYEKWRLHHYRYEDEAKMYGVTSPYAFDPNIGHYYSTGITFDLTEPERGSVGIHWHEYIDDGEWPRWDPTHEKSLSFWPGGSYYTEIIDRELIFSGPRE